MNQLLEFEKIKAKHQIGSNKNKQFLTNLLYLTPLGRTMQYIIPYYWEQPKSIIDITAGNRLIWSAFPYNHKTLLDDNQGWHVEFNDLSVEAKADYHLPAQKIHTLGKHWDIGVVDFPFIELDKGMESFGVHSRAHRIRSGNGSDDPHLRREFYFRYFVPPEVIFSECVESFNKCMDSLIIKMGDSHHNKVLIPNHVFALWNFDKRFNPESEFYCIDIIHYRGNYAKRGAKVQFAQPVISYYLIFKKDVESR